MTPCRLSGSGRDSSSASRSPAAAKTSILPAHYLFWGDKLTFRVTKVAWTDRVQHLCRRTLGVHHAGSAIAGVYELPETRDGRDLRDGRLQPDGLVYISGEWHQATVSTQTVTSNIQFLTAVQGAHKTAGRIYSLRDWAPIWEFGKPETLKTSVGGNIKIPSYVFRGFVDATGEVGATVGDASELEGAVASLVGWCLRTNTHKRRSSCRNPNSRDKALTPKRLTGDPGRS